MLKEPPCDIGSSELSRFREIFRVFEPFTMVDEQAYVASLFLVASHTLREGAILECGTWRGGMAAGLMTVGGPTREYHFFDSFQGLPEPGEEDGEEARRWKQNVNGPRYFNNCTASQSEFEKVLATVRPRCSNVHVHPGFFKEAFQSVDLPKIAVLRLDADWFASTLLCLQKFWSALLPGGLVLIDDYYDWVGCRRAVHDHLSRLGAAESIRQTGLGRICYIEKC
jgi:O-methyltransferase